MVDLAEALAVVALHGGRGGVGDFLAGYGGALAGELECQGLAHVAGLGGEAAGAVGGHARHLPFADFGYGPGGRARVGHLAAVVEHLVAGDVLDGVPA